MNVSTTLNDAQMQTAHIIVKDAAGKTDAVTPATWTTSDPTICTVDSSADPVGRSAVMTAGNPGQCVVTATCGAASLAIAVAVTASGDTEIDATFDPPVNQTPPAPATPAA